MSRVTILWDADGPGPAIAFKEYEGAARGFKLELRSIEVRGPNPDFAGAFQAAKTDPLDALIVVANPLMGEHAKQVFEIATKNRLVTMTEADPIRRGRRPDLLWSEFSRFLSARRRVRCRDLEGS